MNNLETDRSGTTTAKFLQTIYITTVLTISKEVLFCALHVSLCSTHTKTALHRNS
jgi:hypothetical protein